MESFREKFCNCVKYLKNKITSEQNYQLIETQRKIYYFSKFSLDLNESIKIYELTKNFKESLFRNMLELMKYCCKGKAFIFISEVVTFTKPSDERTMLLSIFTVCYLHFYSNFSYEETFTFDSYFTQGLVNLCSKYNIFINDMKKFKLFCYSFYCQIQKEIRTTNYSEIKRLYKYYNPRAETEFEGDILTNSLDFKSQIVHKIKSYINNQIQYYEDVKYNFTEMVNKKIMTPLVSTTETIVNMVLAVDGGSTTIGGSSNTSSKGSDKDKQSDDMMEVEKGKCLTLTISRLY
jgi:hypothetical protein